MREIKFRAWDSHSKKMLHSASRVGHILHWNDGRCFTSITDFDTDSPRHILMQFTGIHDKSGKDVYEGDIVIVKDYPFYGDDPCEKELNYVGEVFWDEEGLRWCYELHVVSNRVRGAACGDVLCNWKHDDKNSSEWEVIGNIHQHSSLLEAQ